MGFNKDKKLIEYKPISRYTFDGKFVKKYNSALDAADDFDFDLVNKSNVVRSIVKCCEGLTMNYKQHIFIYYENTWLPGEDQRSLKFKLRDIVNQYSLEGVFIAKYPRVLEASLLSKVNAKQISHCINLKSKMIGEKQYTSYTAGGFLWLYEKDIHLIDERIEEYKKSLIRLKMNNKELLSKKIIQMSKDGEFLITHPSIHEANRITGITRSGISKCCKGELKTAGGYIWMYEEDYNKLKR